MDAVGIDNDMRQYFFGEGASTRWSRERLCRDIPTYRHESVDIRDAPAIDAIFQRYGGEIAAVIHTAAQPSHDWAAREPVTDFTTNANGTLNLLEATRRHAEGAVFIFTSTNKVYGDTPNTLPLVELETRWELSPDHPWAAHGIPESMSIDQTLHSLFGASKVAADVLVQEYGRLFRHEDGGLPGRLPDRAGPFRSRASRLPVVPDEMRGQRQALYGVRLQGQAGPRQHPFPRPRVRLLGILPGAAFRRRLQHGRRPVFQLLHAGSDPDLRGTVGAADECRLPGRQPRRRPYLVDQRYQGLPARLPGLAPAIQPAPDHGRHPRRLPRARTR